MLRPDQVAPFLAHADRFVSQVARDYFRHCGDPAPVNADAVWAAIDRTPVETEGTRDFWGEPDPHRDRRRLVDCLSYVPHTDASVRRLADAIAAGPPARLAEAYQRAARDVDLPALVRHRELLLSCDGLDDDVRDHLMQRLHLAETCSPDEAWDRLMAAAAASDGKYLNELDNDQIDVAVEAAAGHMDALAPRAMALLADADVDDYRELFVIRMVGHARYPAAVGLLVDKLDVEDDDGIHEEVPPALGRIGTDDVIDRLVAMPGNGDWGRRLSPGSSLSRMKQPAAEAGLLRLLAAERDEEIQVHLLNDLIDLASLAGLDKARLLIAADPRHPESVGLCERLLGVAAMHGLALPEERRWRERVDEHERRVAERISKADQGGLAAFARRMGQLGGLNPTEPAPPAPYRQAKLPPPPPLPGEYDPYATFEPIRNAAAKVGRNDPCPCGSGKKHKKCCGAAKA